MDETVEALTAILLNTVRKQEKKVVYLFVCSRFRYFQWPFAGVSSCDTRATEL